jgi:hypothetical protein
MTHHGQFLFNLGESTRRDIHILSASFWTYFRR